MSWRRLFILSVFPLFGFSLAAGQETIAKPTSSVPSAKPARAELRVFTKVVGEIDGRTVTSREVKINDAIEQALSQKSSFGDGFRVLKESDKGPLAAAIGRVLDEWMIYLEARSMSAQAVPKQDVSSALKVVQDLWSEQPDWQELEVSPDELKDAIERKIAAKNFEKIKSDPSLVLITDDEALAYFRKNRQRFGAALFSTHKEKIKAFLLKRQVDERLAEWKDLLRKKYKVRNLGTGE